MLVIAGDSHAKSLAGIKVDGVTCVERRSGTWHVIGIGGATARGLSSDESTTGARRKIIEYLDGHPTVKKTVFLIFGDVDCVDHIIRSSGDVPGAVGHLNLFIDHLMARLDVTRTVACSVYPRTTRFRIYDTGAVEVNRVINEWNSLLVDPVTFPCLMDDDGYLVTDLCHSINDPGERHLSPRGIELVWSSIESHIQAIDSVR